MRYLLSTAFAAALAVPSFAQDRALLIGNDAYANGRDVSAALDMLDVQAPLEELGFEVTLSENATAQSAHTDLISFAQTVDGEGRIIIAASGHFARSAQGSWLLGVDADAPAFGGPVGVDVDTLIEIAARAPGQSVVLLGLGTRRMDLGTGLEAGVILDDIPQGVTVIVGPAAEISDFAQQGLAVSGQSLAAALSGWPSLAAYGFLAPRMPFITAAGEAPVSATPDPDANERAFWTATQDIGTVDAYQTYLSRYANGLFSQEATAKIADIKNAPALQAEAAEDALNLSRDARREIQRALSLIGFDPRGIDGIFGPGSRAAITAFQTENGETGTGFITRDQIETLEAQAEIRAVELEREAQARQAELERKDRAYWEATGALGDEAGLRAYMQRYPDGVFAEIALARLEPFEEKRRAAAQAEDRAAWDAAVQTNTVAGFQKYLQTSPNGAFADQARAQLAELQQSELDADALAIAARNEERLGLNGATRRLVESRLERAGLKPGKVDGAFDDDTRRAIRRYQESRSLNKTGYLNQETVVRLLAEAVLR